MKLLICLLLCFLTGCGTMVRDEYLHVSPHVEANTQPSTEAEGEMIPVVTNRTELRGAVLACIRNWQEQGEIRVENYEGDVKEGLKEALHYAAQEDPIGAYAVDYADGEYAADTGVIRLSIVFRRSAAEISSIITVNNYAVTQSIQQALRQGDTALTLQVRNYQDMDFPAYIRRYCLENPERVVAVPEISAEVYPKEGSMRIVELHFSYPESREEMEKKRQEVEVILRSLSAYVKTGETDRERASLLYRYLTARYYAVTAQEEPSMPAYSLLCENVAHGLSLASVFQAQCNTAVLRCRTVSGTRNGVPHYWNLLYIGEECYYVDLLRSLERHSTDFVLLYEEDLLAEGYEWNRESYPACPRPVEFTQPPAPTEEPATEAPVTESSAPVESTEESVPTESEA